MTLWINKNVHKTLLKHRVNGNHVMPNGQTLTHDFVSEAEWHVEIYREETMDRGAVKRTGKEKIGVDNDMTTRAWPPHQRIILSSDTKSQASWQRISSSPSKGMSATSAGRSANQSVQEHKRHVNGQIGPSAGTGTWASDQQISLLACAEAK